MPLSLRCLALLALPAAALVALDTVEEMAHVDSLLQAEGADCHTAVEGEECFDHVVWAMDHGIHETPEKYSETLTADSSFEEFQDAIRSWHTSCAEPCWTSLHDRYGHILENWDAATPKKDGRKQPSAKEQHKRKRSKMMEEKSAMDLRVIQEVRSRQASSWSWPDWTWAAGPPKVAYLFFLMDQLEEEEPWDSFFGGAPDPRFFSVYTHRAGVPNLANSTARKPLEKWNPVEVPWVETSWCALFGASVALLNEALQDPANVQFVFVSHNTAPLKSFAYVYQDLMATVTKSKFCFASPAKHDRLYHEWAEAEARKKCFISDFYNAIDSRAIKHHQWITLSRDHARAVVDKAEEALARYKEVWMQAAPDAPHDGCSDEGVPIIALLLSQEDPSQDVWADLERLGVIPECTTFVGWRHCFANTVFNLDKPIIHDVKAILEEVTFDDILHPNKKGNDEGFMNKLKHKLNGFPTYFDQVELDYLASLTEHGFLFGRKFNRGASVTEKGRDEQPLTEVLPLLWEHTDRDPEHSHALRWRTLDAAGAPPVSSTRSWVGRNLRRARNAVFGDRRWRPDYLTQSNPLAFHLVAQNWRESVRQRVHDDQITWTTEDNELQ